jgi:hypothetical protein
MRDTSLCTLSCVIQICVHCHVPYSSSVYIVMYDTALCAPSCVIQAFVQSCVIHLCVHCNVSYSSVYSVVCDTALCALSCVIQLCAHVVTIRKVQDDWSCRCTAGTGESLQHTKIGNFTLYQSELTIYILLHSSAQQCFSMVLRVQMVMPTCSCNPFGKVDLPWFIGEIKATRGFLEFEWCAPHVEDCVRKETTEGESRLASCSIRGCI